ncbi:hypothetical protein K493DRAFT_318809 [Basidiobolus meristosporus CBS 931.73]|uniref:Uncharacterized protein n=1 Tax=Basidiobolus meristosporus CBS 931.73 TaxID=1314790 RepID=A0A1Y1XVG9_9FUNG|nr:hypothetical protein K493DRAFT_318809 [Basidiobolus meristosporus CBS 931.73]|eukprot:ORX89294.1 hypothetical protein K493DRAFT_318809 [Basidiobolus meristosporus CBS 931.73]
MDLLNEGEKNLLLNSQILNRISKLPRAQLEILLIKASNKHADIRQLILYSTERFGQNPRVTQEVDQLVAWYEQFHSPELSVTARFTLLTSITLSIVRSPQAFGLHESGYFSICTDRERYQLKRERFTGLLGEKWKGFWLKHGKELGEMMSYQKSDWKKMVELFKRWEASLKEQRLSLGNVYEIRIILERLNESQQTYYNKKVVGTDTDSETSSLTATTNSELSASTS